MACPSFILDLQSVLPFGVQCVVPQKHTDGSCYWPDKEYICDVDDTDVLKMSILSEDILSGKAAIVRVKLLFNSGERNAAHSAFRVSIKTSAELMKDLLQTCLNNKFIDFLSCFYIIKL